MAIKGFYEPEISALKNNTLSSERRHAWSSDKEIARRQAGFTIDEEYGVYLLPDKGAYIGWTSAKSKEEIVERAKMYKETNEPSSNLVDKTIFLADLILEGYDISLGKQLDARTDGVEHYGVYTQDYKKIALRQQRKEEELKREEQEKYRRMFELDEKEHSQATTIKKSSGNVVWDELESKVEKAFKIENSDGIDRTEAQRLYFEVGVAAITFGFDYQPYKAFAEMILSNNQLGNGEQLTIKADKTQTFDDPTITAIFGGQTYSESTKNICGIDVRCQAEMTLSEYANLYKNTVADLAKCGKLTPDMIEETRGFVVAQSGRKGR